MKPLVNLIEDYPRAARARHRKAPSQNSRNEFSEFYLEHFGLVRTAHNMSTQLMSSTRVGNSSHKLSLDHKDNITTDKILPSELTGKRGRDSARNSILNLSEVDQVTTAALGHLGIRGSNSEIKRRLPRKFVEMLNVAARKYIEHKPEFGKIFEEIDLLSVAFEEVTERIRCYKAELGNTVDGLVGSVRRVLLTAIEQSHKLISSIERRHEKNVAEHLKTVDRLNREKNEITEKYKQITELFNLQDAEVKIHMMNIESLKHEVSVLHELLKKDVEINPRCDDYNRVDEINYAAATSNQVLDENVKNLTRLINDMEAETSNKATILESMEGLMRDMMRSARKEVAVQVDECDLSWKARSLMPKPQLDEIFEEAQKKRKEEAGPIESPRVMEEKSHAVDKRQNREEADLLAATAGQDTWQLTGTLLVFLDNVTNENATARVLPWPHFKKLIFDIYSDRISNSWEIEASPEKNTPMDELLIMFFLKKNKLRRLAETKLLEFLVSLKYYSKTNCRASTFASLVGLLVPHATAKVSPVPTEGGVKYDYYLLAYFLHAFAKITKHTEMLVENPNDGVTWLDTRGLETFNRELLPFLTEQAMQKFNAKLNKYIRGQPAAAEGRPVAPQTSAPQYIDLDKLLVFYIIEFSEARKRNLKNLITSFSRRCEKDEGLLAVHDVKDLVGDTLPIASHSSGLAFPQEFSVVRAFLHALTSSKNSFTINLRDFAIAVNKYGLDVPFPCLVMPYVDANHFFNLATPDHTGYSLGSKQNKGPGATRYADQVKPFMQDESKSPAEKPNEANKKMNISSIVAGILTKPTEAEQDLGKTLNNQVANIPITTTSAVFSQHFSILRELRSYSNQMKEMMMKQQDLPTLWKTFENVLAVLDSACLFLNFPIQA